MAPKLRAVQPGEVPAKPPARARTRSIAQAAASGSERAVLVALRKRLATAIEDPKCPPAPLAALTRQLLDVCEKLEQLDRTERQGRAAGRQEGGSGGAIGDEAFDAAAI